MLILLTNDDGVHSEGLLALVEVLSPDHTVYVVAPERERTCVGHAITLHKPLRARQVQGRIFASNGTPVDCVYLGVKKLLPRRPDLIISGINSGPNMGQDVNYSGTVAAAKEGAFLGIPSMALSIVARDGFLFRDAARVGAELAPAVGGTGVPEGFAVLNVNVPNLPFQEIRGFQVTRLGKRIYTDNVIERVDPRGRAYYWIGGDGDRYEPTEGTDFFAVDHGFVSITPLALDPTSLSSIDHYTKQLRRVL